jgi:hypothetical protein
MNQLWIQQEEMMSHWPNPSSFLVKAQSSTSTLYYHHTQSVAGLTSRQSSSRLSRYFMKPRQSHQICTIVSKKIENHCRASYEDSYNKGLRSQKWPIRQQYQSSSRSNSRTNNLTSNQKRAKDYWWTLSWTRRIHEIWRRVAERNQQRQGNRGIAWRSHYQNPQNINNVENPQFNQHSKPCTRGGFAYRGRGRGRGPPKFRIMTQMTHTSTANIMEEAIAPKRAQKPKRT